MSSTIRLGDLEVNRLGFGAMQLCGPMVYGEPPDPERCKATLRRTRELGVQLIDTSWYYGPLVANRLIFETLHPYGKDLVIATKLGGRRTPDAGWAHALRPEELRRRCERDLESLTSSASTSCICAGSQAAKFPFSKALDAMIRLQAEAKFGTGLST